MLCLVCGDIYGQEISLSMKIIFSLTRTVRGSTLDVRI